MSSEKKIEKPVIKVHDLEADIISSVFFDKEGHLIYVFTYDSVIKYTSDMKAINELKFEKPINRVIQNVDGHFLILLNDELLHYHNDTATEMLKQSGIDIPLISPNGEWILVSIVKEPKINGRNYSIFTDKIFRFHNYAKLDCFDTSKTDLKTSNIFNICDDGSVLNIKDGMLTKYEDWKVKKTLSLFETRALRLISSQLISGCKTLILLTTEFKYLIINLETFSIDVVKAKKVNCGSRHFKVDQNGLFFILGDNADLKLYDINTGEEKVINIIESQDKKITTNGIKKINNFVLVYNSDARIFIYNLITKVLEIDYKFHELNGVLQLKSLLPSNGFPNAILYSNNLVAFIYINRIAEKHNFLLGSLVDKRNIKSSANNFMNDILFDRHLLPLIFGFVSLY